MASASTESTSMKGGDDPNSYAQNSQFQREAVENVFVFINQGIAEKLDLEQLLSSSSSPLKAFVVADLGCSVGPNSIIAVDNIIESVKSKYQSYANGSTDNQDNDNLEFQVLFNDLVSNDFNTLFKSLPPNREYFASGVPGRFQDRLFPKASVHFVHSSYALHWLATTPKELMDRESPAFNKGRIYYHNSPKEVGEAYAAQYAKEFESFLGARAAEVVHGGLMALVLLCLPDDVPPSHCTASGVTDILEASLSDMAKEGLVSEDKLDSFNLPMYYATPRELEGFIKQNGCFTMERMEEIVSSEAELAMLASDHRAVISHLRAVWEGILGEQFGAENMDELFDRLLKKLVESSPFSQMLKYKHMTELFVLLKRKTP